MVIERGGVNVHDASYNSCHADRSFEYLLSRMTYFVNSPKRQFYTSLSSDVSFH